MSVALNSDELIARARADFRMGAGIVLRTDEQKWLAVSAETVNEDRFAAMKAFGTIELVITNWRAAKLMADGPEEDLVRLYVPDDKNLDWVRSMADPVDDEINPTNGPFETVCSTESEPHRAALAISKMAQLLPVVLLLDVTCADTGDLHQIELSMILEGIANGASPLQKIADAPVPLRYSDATKVHVFRPFDGGEEHYAIEVGAPSRDAAVLSRLHSACFTGDVIGSLKCDCGPQLDAAMKKIAAEGGGILLYMNQEGRGIGLANKMRAYTLQAQGHDTVDANHHLGFEDDERNFKLGAEILNLLGFSEVRLMTNNPKKVQTMELAGIKVVERVPLIVGENPLNEEYLKIKAKKSGHLL